MRNEENVAFPVQFDVLIIVIVVAFVRKRMHDAIPFKITRNVIESFCGYFQIINNVIVGHCIYCRLDVVNTIFEHIKIIFLVLGFGFLLGFFGFLLSFKLQYCWTCAIHAIEEWREKKCFVFFVFSSHVLSINK